MIGTTIGNFEVTRALGHGGMGEVWLAQHKDIKTRVAIKTLLPHISEDKQQVQRFFNEAVAVSKIKHAGITKIFDVGFLPSGAAYLIMEYLEGESLAARIARIARLRLRELADITRQIAGVLDATHAAGITHRDLKPDNIFLVRRRRAGARRAREGARLRHREARRADRAMTGERHAGYAALHVARAVEDPGLRRWSRRRLLARLHRVRDGVRHTAVHRELDGGGVHDAPDRAGAVAPRTCRHAAGADRRAPVSRMLAKAPDARPGLREIRTAFGEIEAEAAAEGPAIVAFASTMPDGSPANAMAATAASGSAELVVRSNEAALPPASPRAPTVVTAAPVVVSNTTLGNAASVINKPVAQPTRPWWAIVGGLAVVAAGVVVWNVTRTGDHEPAPASQPASTSIAQPVPPPSAAASAPPSVVPPVDAGSAVTSHVHVAATPATAKIRIDKEEVANPFDGDVPRDAMVHHIRITAPGYQEELAGVTFAKDQDLKYTLVAEPSVHHDGSSAPATPNTTTYTGKAKGTIFTGDPDHR